MAVKCRIVNTVHVKPGRINPGADSIQKTHSGYDNCNGSDLWCTYGYNACSLDLISFGNRLKYRFAVNAIGRYGKYGTPDRCHCVVCCAYPAVFVNRISCRLYVLR